MSSEVQSLFDSRRTMLLDLEWIFDYSLENFENFAKAILNAHQDLPFMEFYVFSKSFKAITFHFVCVPIGVGNFAVSILQFCLFLDRATFTAFDHVFVFSVSVNNRNCEVFNLLTEVNMTLRLRTSIWNNRMLQLQPWTTPIVQQVPKPQRSIQLLQQRHQNLWYFPKSAHSTLHLLHRLTWRKVIHII